MTSEWTKGDCLDGGYGKLKGEDGPNELLTILRQWRWTL